MSKFFQNGQWNWFGLSEALQKALYYEYFTEIDSSGDETDTHSPCETPCDMTSIIV